MLQNPTLFEWTKEQIDAAKDVATGELTQEEIAAKAGVERMTLYRWRKHPEFAARIDEHVEEFRRAASQRGIGALHRRVAAQDDRWQRMQRIIKERGAAPDMQAIPGGSTGLLVRSYKSIGGGEDAEKVEEYTFDTGLAKSMLDHEKQAAQELGQWEEKVSQEISGKGGAPIPIEYVNDWRPYTAPDSATLPASGPTGSTSGEAPV